MGLIRKNALYNSAYQVVRIIFPLLTYPYVSRIFGPSGLGQVSYAQSIAEYFAAVALLGLPMYGVRQISKLRNQPLALTRLFSELLVLSGFFSLVAAAMYLSLPLVAPGLIKHRVLFILFAAQVLFAFAKIDWVFQGLENYSFVVTRNLVIRIATVVLLFIVVKDRSDLATYALLWVSGTVLGGVINLGFAFRRIGASLSGLRPFSHLRQVVPTVAVQLISMLYSIVDVVMLGLLVADNAVSVGLYSLAGRLMRIVLSILNAGINVVTPRVAFHFGEGDSEKVDNLVRKSFAFTLFFSLPVSFGLLITAPELIIVFAGSGFADAVLTARLLAPLVSILSLNAVIAFQLLYPQNREKPLLQASVLSLVVAVVLNLLLIPRGRQDGAAVATLVATIVGVILQSLSVRVQVRRTLFTRDNARLVLIFVGWAILVWAVRVVSPFTTDALRLAWTTVLGVLLYAGLGLVGRLAPALELYRWMVKSNG